MTTDIVAALYSKAQLRPSAPALQDDSRLLTFKELLASAKRIHRLLSEFGISPGDRVAIYSDNTVEYILAMYGIMHAGCTFVPLPFREPEARTRRLYVKAAPAAVFADRTRNISGAVRVFDIKDIDTQSRTTDAADSQWPAPIYAPETSAYIIFTSGSTGEPKGVCVSRQGFYYAVYEAERRMGFDSSTRSLAVLPLHFDGSFSSVFPVLMAGGSVFVNRGPVCLPTRFCAIFAKHRITHTTLTPTYLKALVEADEWSPVMCGSWCTLATGGESPSKPVLRRLKQQIPRLRVFNRYGPTEATMSVATHEIDQETLSSHERIPIGLPHEGVEFIALGPAGGPISTGEIGELYIGGRQLMVGYFDDPESTGALLKQLTPGGPLLLKTGDLVTKNARGHYIFVDRADNIVKRHGNRIALAEIETAMSQLDGVTVAVCVAVKVADAVQIIAFLQRSNDRIGEPKVRRDLLRQLPSYMNPDSIQFLPVMPKTANGKIDRNALQELATRQVVDKE